MRPVQYSLISDRIENAPCSPRTAYGIAAHSAERFSVIRDISSCRRWVKKLVDQLNLLQVSLYHFQEIVEDALNA